MHEDEAAGVARRAWLLRDFRTQCEATVADRVNRHLRVDHHAIVANTPFAGPSSECVALFTDGHFYGCISLSQAVGEALVRHMCRSNHCKVAKNFEENITTLRRRQFIDDAIESEFLQLWRERDKYHHLNGNIATDRAELEELSFTKIRNLATVEAWVFAHTQGETGLILRHRQYWPTPDSADNVFLRFDV
jgi:hypothetical protein